MYRFLKLNNYHVQLIKLELQEMEKYYHNALSCAKLRKKRKKKLEEDLALLQEQADRATDAANAFQNAV